MSNRTFESQRREPFLDEQSFNWNVEYTTAKCLPKLRIDLADATLNPLDRIECLWRLSSASFDHAVRLYSAGHDVIDLVAHIRQSVLDAQEFLDQIEDGSQWPQLDLAIQTYYVHALWILSLAKLLGQDALIDTVANLYAADETNDGADELFELILAKLGRKSYEAEGLIHEDPYQLLLDCIKAEPDERPALMTQFLKRWFKGQQECDWWGAHINRRGGPILKTGFFGYWAFEAALVTYLWDIDDSSYRDLPHYPKDLIDYARQNASAPTPVDPLPGRAQAGQPCPREGWWSTPAKADSRRHFKQGEIMPEVAGDYGVTIWQWDASQEA